jgi:lysylphosphatidylglycerol synthetase-like protein (DUF2156 family)
MKCVICGIEVDSPEKAMDEGWIPAFYEGQKEHGPACAGCSESLIELGEDGEMQLKGKYQGKINYKESQEEAPKEGFAIGIALRDKFPTS